MIAVRKHELWLPLNGATTDLSGKGSSVSVVGTPAYVTGRLGRGIELNAASERIEVAHAARLEPARMTVAFWLYIVSQSSWQVYLSKMVITGTSFDGGWAFSTCTPTTNHLGEMGFYVNGTTNSATSAVVKTGAGTLVTGAWTHLAATVGTAGVRIYQDGALRQTQAFSYTVSSLQPIKINPALTLYNSINAHVDDVHLLSEELSPSSVRELFQGFHPKGV